MHQKHERQRTTQIIAKDAMREREREKGGGGARAKRIKHMGRTTFTIDH